MKNTQIKTMEIEKRNVWKRRRKKLNRYIQRQWMVDEREDSKIGLKVEWYYRVHRMLKYDNSHEDNLYVIHTGIQGA